MSPIPSEARDPKPHELTTGDGRTFKIKVPGLTPPAKPGRTEERDGPEPPREGPRPPVNPDHAGVERVVPVVGRDLADERANTS
jgi:hypothetical protein